jgi:hypothetical protein
MDNDQLDDLKQFILATVSQATANMATKDDLAHSIAQLDTTLDDLDLKLDTIADTFNDRLNNHETRLTRLEKQAA